MLMEDMGGEWGEEGERRKEREDEGRGGLRTGRTGVEDGAEVCVHSLNRRTGKGA